MSKDKVSFIDENGGRQQVALQPEVYKAAMEENLTTRQFINQKYPTTSDAKHDTFTQMCGSAGLIFNQDKKMGVNSANLKSILDGKVNFDASTGSVVREVSPVQSRVLFPAAVLEYVEDALMVDRESAVNVFDQTIALNTTVASARVEQPTISYTGKDGPDEARSQITSQLALPPAMMTITASEITKKIPTYSLGLQVSDEALQATTLDLVGLALSRQAEIERDEMVGETLLALLQGDADVGDAVLTQVKADTLDTDLDTAGTLSQKAWTTWLYTNLRSRRIDWVFCDINAALAIEGRSGKPVVTGDDPNSPRIDTLFNIAHPQLVENVKMYIVPVDYSWPANTIMGIDSRYAIAKLTNSNAEYSAVERFALRKGSGIRFDFGNLYYRLYDAAFSVLSLTLTT